MNPFLSGFLSTLGGIVALGAVFGIPVIAALVVIAFLSRIGRRGDEEEVVRLSGVEAESEPRNGYHDPRIFN